MKTHFLVIAALLLLLGGYGLGSLYTQKFGSGTQTVTFPGNLVVGGTVTFTGGAITASSTLYAATIGTLTVTSTSALQGAVTLSSTLGVANALSTLSSLSVTGTSALTGAATFGSTLGVANALSTLSSLSVTGTSVLTGAVTLGSTLGVANALTTLSSLSVTGTSALTTMTIGSGTSLDKHLRATATVDPDSLGAGNSTTTVVTVTGAVAGDHCDVNVTAGDLLSTTSTAVLACRAGTDNVTVYYYNATGTAAFNAATSTLSAQVWSY